MFVSPDTVSGIGISLQIEPLAEPRGRAGFPRNRALGEGLDMEPSLQYERVVRSESAKR